MTNVDYNSIIGSVADISASVSIVRQSSFSDTVGSILVLVVKKRAWYIHSCPSRHIDIFVNHVHCRIYCRGREVGAPGIPLQRFRTINGFEYKR